MQPSSWHAAPKPHHAGLLISNKSQTHMRIRCQNASLDERGYDGSSEP